MAELPTFITGLLYTYTRTLGGGLKPPSSLEAIETIEVMETIEDGDDGDDDGDDSNLVD